MSVDDPRSVDFVAVEREDGRVVLAIADHLTWGDPLQHLYVLQEKLNAYVEFIESGQVWEVASERSGVSVRKGAPIEVRAYLRHEPPEIFSRFVEEARGVLGSIGAYLTVEIEKES